MNTANTCRHPRIGDVYLMRFDGNGNEQKGWRPGLVFQNNVGNIYSPNIIALPFTSSIKKTAQPTHVYIPAYDAGIVKDSLILCENPECMSKERIGKYLTTLPEKYMKEVAIASILSSSAISYIDPNTLSAVWEKANRLNTVA